MASDAEEAELGEERQRGKAKARRLLDLRATRRGVVAGASLGARGLIRAGRPRARTFSNSSTEACSQTCAFWGQDISFGMYRLRRGNLGGLQGHVSAPTRPEGCAQAGRSEGAGRVNLTLKTESSDMFLSTA